MNLSAKIETLIREEVARRSSIDAEQVRIRLEELCRSFSDTHLLGGKPKGDYSDVVGSIRVAMRDLGLWEGEVYD